MSVTLLALNKGQLQALVLCSSSLPNKDTALAVHTLEPLKLYCWICTEDKQTPVAGSLQHGAFSKG